MDCWVLIHCLEGRSPEVEGRPAFHGSWFRLGRAARLGNWAALVIFRQESSNLVASLTDVHQGYDNADAAQPRLHPVHC
jgi:hypothetical protein